VLDSLEGLKGWKLATHNGRVTVVSRKSGEWRTVRVRRLPADSSFAPGQRVLELLTGADNESDYRAFAFVSDAGAVHVWRKHQSSAVMCWLADAVANPERFQAAAVFVAEGACRRCNRALTTPESVLSGIGPTCAEREGG